MNGKIDVKKITETSQYGWQENVRVPSQYNKYITVYAFVNKVLLRLKYPVMMPKTDGTMRGA